MIYIVEIEEREPEKWLFVIEEAKVLIGLWSQGLNILAVVRKE
jgi:hypothetical protein